MEKPHKKFTACLEARIKDLSYLYMIYVMVLSNAGKLPFYSGYINTWSCGVLLVLVLLSQTVLGFSVFREFLLFLFKNKAANFSNFTGDLVDYVVPTHPFNALNYDDKVLIKSKRPTPVLNNWIQNSKKQNCGFNINNYSRYVWLTWS